MGCRHSILLSRHYGGSKYFLAPKRRQASHNRGNRGYGAYEFIAAFYVSSDGSCGGKTPCHTTVQSVADAMDTLNGLNPVKFTYRASSDEKHVGFIAEDVPDLVATADRKGMSAMDVVAVLTKVVPEQQKTVREQKLIIAELSKRLDLVEKRAK